MRKAANGSWLMPAGSNAARRAARTDRIEQVVQNLEGETCMSAERLERRQGFFFQTGDSGARFEAEHEQCARLLVLELGQRFRIRAVVDFPEIPLLASA